MRISRSRHCYFPMMHSFLPRRGRTPLRRFNSSSHIYSRLETILLSKSKDSCDLITDILLIDELTSPRLKSPGSRFSRITMHWRPHGYSSPAISWQILSRVLDASRFFFSSFSQKSEPALSILNALTHIPTCKYSGNTLIWDQFYPRR
jgi:hypothetical protein